MATLPRRNSSMARLISSPFSTSPRKLQEMTGTDNHDTTNASGISMKQYEEQIVGLRKENFNLKLRVYFLEERLGSNAPPPVQGLLEHNVRLQVQVEELKKQISDKQELLAAAAKAIDALEQQGSIYLDSEDGSTNGSTALRRRVRHIEEQVIESEDNIKLLYPETDVSVQKPDQDTPEAQLTESEHEELLRLRKEHLSACQMIRGCMKRIQQQERQIRKLSKENESRIEKTVDDELDQIKKLEEILRCKDEHIQGLEAKLKEMQNRDHYNDIDPSKNLQELLTRRLQGLAFFLDKLLLNKCVLGEDKKKLAESLLEQSLALPVGLQLDESMAPGDFTMDESSLDVSQALKLEDLTLMLGHHHMGDACQTRLKESKMNCTWPPQVEGASESECWSEPDRKVSLARIGLRDVKVECKVNSSDEPRMKLRRNRSQLAKMDSNESDKRQSLDNVLKDELDRLRSEKLFIEETLTQYKKNEQARTIELRNLQEELECVKAERDQLSTQLSDERIALNQTQSEYLECARRVSEAEARCQEYESALQLANENSSRMRQQSEESLKAMTDRYNEAEERYCTIREMERSLRRQADEATLAASQAALDRTRCQHERIKAERDAEDARLRLRDEEGSRRQAELLATQLQDKIRETESKVCDMQHLLAAVKHAGSDDDSDTRPTSPDQGIDSDRLSSLELTDGNEKAPCSLLEENKALRSRLARTKQSLSEVLAQLGAANNKKLRVQRAICREIHKTHGVLRAARDHLEASSPSSVD